MWIFVFLLFKLNSTSSSNYQKTQNMKIAKRQRTQRCRIQAWAKSQKGENPRITLVIESYQSDISETQYQDQYCHKIPQVFPPPSLLPTSQSHKEQHWSNLCNFWSKFWKCHTRSAGWIFYPVIASETTKISHVWETITVENMNLSFLSLRSLSLSPLTFVIFSSFYCTKINVFGWVIKWGQTCLIYTCPRGMNGYT